jgi:hypothetical protein
MRHSFLAFALLTAAILLAGQNTILAQVLSDDEPFQADLRPFDFADKFYITNGVDPEFLKERRDGMDKLSIIDYAWDPQYRNVRIVGTWPAYSADGSAVYWNKYAEFDKDAFIPGPDGEQALSISQGFPIYRFPSNTVKGVERQAAMIFVDEDYFKKNPIGLGLIIDVTYTWLADTPKGQQILKEFIGRNGYSLDETPIICTKSDLDELVQMGLVELRVRMDGPSFVVAKAIRDPQFAIAPDAFLLPVTRSDGTHLPAEEAFVKQFECFKDGKGC